MSADDLIVQRGVVLPADELSWTAARSGGPGGQHVNKTSSKVVLRWSLRGTRALGPRQRERAEKALASRLTTEGELIVAVDEGRSQLSNLRLARERLAELLRQALVVPKVRRATKPTKGSQRRRLAGKKHRSDIKRQRGRPGRDD